MTRKPLLALAIALAIALPMPAPGPSPECRSAVRSDAERGLLGLGTALSMMEQKRRLLAQLEELEQSLSVTTGQVHALSTNLQRIVVRKSQIEQELRATETQLKKTREKAKARLIALYKFSAMNYTLPLATVHDLHTAIQAVTAIGKLLAEDRKMFRTLKSRQLQIATMKASLGEYQCQVEELHKQLEHQARNLRETKEEKIHWLIELNRAPTAAPFGATAGVPGNPAESDKIGGHPGELLQDLTASKGQLPVPVQGKAKLTYGTKKYSHYANVLYNSGILIETRRGQPVNAIHRGRVLFADRFKGYGKIMEETTTA